MDGSGVVLLVDDDELWLRACERGFRGLAGEVYSTTNLSDALATAEEHTPDLVVADVRIGSESGMDLIEPLRQSYPGCRIVMVSAYLSVALTARLVRKGAHLVLFKPVHPGEIVRQLEQGDADDPAWVTPTLARAEWEHIQRILSDTHNNISETARRLGITRRTLQLKLKKYPPQF